MNRAHINGRKGSKNCAHQAEIPLSSYALSSHKIGQKTYGAVIKQFVHIHVFIGSGTFTHTL